MDIDPLILIAACALLSSLLWWPRSRPAGIAIASAIPLLLLLASMPIVPYEALSMVGARYRPFERSEDPAARVVVLMGAGTTTVLGRSYDMQVLTPVAAARVLEAARVYHALDRPWVISSGGVRQLTRATQPSALAMREALVALGVPAERILLESSSLSTHDEAVLVGRMLRARDATRFVLVTSESHMPRAARVFRAQALDPIPAPAPDFPPDFARERRIQTLRPDMEGLRLSGALLHEWGGVLFYRWKGWM